MEQQTHLDQPQHISFNPDHIKPHSELDNQRLFHEGPSFDGNAISKMGFIPSFKLVKLGASSVPIEHEHLWKLKSIYSTEKCWNTFEPHWRRELEKEDPSVLRALFSAFKVHFFFALLLQAIYASTQFALPLLMPYFIEWFRNNTSLPTYWIYTYIAAVVCSSIVGTLFLYHTSMQSWILGLRLRAALQCAVYRKSLCVAPSRALTSGIVVNLMSTDCQTLSDTFYWFIQGCVAPIWIIVAIGLMSRYVGGFSVIPLGLAILAVPVMIYFSSRIGVYQEHLQRAADGCIKLVREFLSAIRIVKYYAWEDPLLNNIGRARAMELTRVQTLLEARALLNWMLQAVPTLGVGLIFFFYAFNNTLSFDVTFTILTYLNMLRIPFLCLPLLFSYASTYSVALDRIQHFCLRTELKPLTLKTDTNNRGGMEIINGSFSWETETSIIEGMEFDKMTKEASCRLNHLLADSQRSEMTKAALKQATLERKEMAQMLKIARKRKKALEAQIRKGIDVDSSPAGQLDDSGQPLISSSADLQVRKPTLALKKINLNVEKGKLTIIVGSVGAGKSSLAMAFLGELYAASGKVNVYEDFTFAPQEAWILNTTIRDNIVFGREFDPVWYAEVVRACALTSDMHSFPASDLTEIAERGANLSGGQRQRINVARAMYSKAPIVILDDPFSAVDPHVGEHMFAHVVQAMRNQGRTVLLMTNQLHFVPHADYVGVLKKGKLVEQGIFEDVMSDEHGVLATMIAEHTAGSTNEEADYEAADAREKMKKAKNLLFVPTPEKDAENLMKGALIKEEEREKGNINLRFYKQWLKAGVPAIMLTVLAFSALAVAARVSSGVWLIFWSNPSNKWGFNKPTYLGGYIALVVAEVIFSAVITLILVRFSLNVGRSLHHQMLTAVTKAPSAWYDVTPVGRILNRFMRDINTIDNLLPQAVEMTIYLAFSMLGIYASLGAGSPYNLIIVLIGTVVYTIITLIYRKTSIQIQRLEASSRSPIFSHFIETFEGASTIRAFSLREAFQTSSMNKIDFNTIDFVGLRYCHMWFGLTLDMVGNLMTLLTLVLLALLRTYAPTSIDIGFIFLAISFVGSITQTLGSLSSYITDTENKMNSAERVLHYNDLPKEGEGGNYHDPPASWPTKGEIILEDLSVEYKPGVPVLKHLNCRILPKEKIGIVGRTGAGKSTLITALFRTMEPSGGTIKIDGVDITLISLFDLRSKLSIIPQVPQLFMGTIRYNLDPFDDHVDDAVIWNVLKMVKLKKHVKSLGGLYAPIEEGGSNFSVGQRQLLSMARCMLRGTSLLLLDEATAAVDVETDALLQRMLRKNFKDNTVLTIAHRLNTIMDSDRIMVMDAGNIVEFDSPANLLSNKNGILYGMVEATGPATSSFLKAIAFGKESVEDASHHIAEEAHRQSEKELTDSIKLRLKKSKK